MGVCHCVLCYAHVHCICLGYRSHSARTLFPFCHAQSGEHLAPIPF